jgi:hypothetical protein
MPLSPERATGSRSSICKRYGARKGPGLCVNAHAKECAYEERVDYKRSYHCDERTIVDLSPVPHTPVDDGENYG